MEHLSFSKKWYNYFPNVLFGCLIGFILNTGLPGAASGAAVAILLSYNEYKLEKKYIDHINKTYDVINAMQDDNAYPDWNSINYFS